MSSKKKRKETYTVFIPENLDLPKLLREFPINVAHAADYIAYILHQIHHVKAFAKKDEKVVDRGFVFLNSTILQRRVRHYAALIRWLIDREIILMNAQYFVGSRSRGFQFAPAYCTKLKEYNITTSTLIKKIKTRFKKPYPRLLPESLPDLTTDEANSGKDYSEIIEARLFYLKKHFNKDLTIDKDQSEQFLIRKLNLDNPSTDAEHHEAISKYNCTMLVVDAISNANFKFHVDSSAGRLHTSITPLKSELRSFLKYRGQTLYAADIKNSQPFLSLVFLDYDLFVKNDMARRVSIYNDKFSEGNKLLERGRASIMLADFVRANSQNPDILHYRELVLSGNIYQYFGRLLREGEMDRHLSDMKLKKIGKEALLPVFFDKNQAIQYNKAARVFASAFPTVYTIFGMIKEKDNSILACVLQNFEAEIVLHKACKDVHEIRPDALQITIHDSIATTGEHIELVVDVLKKNFRDAIGVSPEIKVEIWGQSMLTPIQHIEAPVQPVIASPEEDIAPVSESGTTATGSSYGFYDDEAIGIYSMQEVARRLSMERNMLSVGRNKLFRFLREQGILMADNKPRQQYIEDGYFTCEEIDFPRSWIKVRVSELGLDFISNLIKEKSTLIIIDDTSEPGKEIKYYVI